MAQCQRIIETSHGERRCLRDALRTAGDALLCWQHYNQLEHAFAAPLIAERAALLRELDTLRAQMPLDEPLGDPDSRPWTIYIARMPHIAPEHPRFGMVKIGRTRNLGQRMDTLGLDPVLWFDERPATYERALHTRFAHLRADGEWFRMAPEISALFEAA